MLSTFSAKAAWYEVFSERFHNSQNENDMNYKNSDHMKFLVFVLRRGLIMSTSRELFEIIRNENVRNEIGRVHVALISQLGMLQTITDSRSGTRSWEFRKLQNLVFLVRSIPSCQINATYCG